MNHQGGAGEDGVLELIHALVHAAKSLQFRVIEESDLGVTRMEARVLGFFARHPGATQSDLVAHSGRDKAQLARLIKGLRERGFLDAVADASDRRSQCLHLTDTGRALQRTLRQSIRKLEAQAVAGLDEAERQELVRLLAVVRDNLLGNDS